MVNKRQAIKRLPARPCLARKLVNPRRANRRFPRVRESRRVLDLILQLRAEGNAVILVTDNMEHVVELVDRAVVSYVRGERLES